MGIAKDKLIQFIDSIPDDDLTTFPPMTGTIYTDKNYRLDNQGKNTAQAGNADTYNLQIQANKGADATSIRKIAPKTVAGPVHLSAALAASAATVRAQFHGAIKI